MGYEYGLLYSSTDISYYYELMDGYNTISILYLITLGVVVSLILMMMYTDRKEK
jgi:hypothetical protein